jgi:RHH-type transcriptional regulator, proline utilization regulon repressor / proline dehydrogenase / delta 1-pyrroline-5-carboxylate dehydrogenase
MAWFGRKQTTSLAAQSPGGDFAQRILEIGGQLLALTRKHRKGFFSAGFWSDQLVAWTMKDPVFRTQLFRFIDVFPMLRTPEQVHDYLSDYLSQPGVTLPTGLDLGLKAGGLAKGLVSKTVAGRIEGMAANFIAGVDAKSALPVLRDLWKQGVAFSVDLLGEACVSDHEAEVYQGRYLDLLEVLPAEADSWPADPRLENDHLGAVPRTSISIKISALSPHTDAIDFEGSLLTLTRALEPILRKAAERKVLVYFDIEQATAKDLTFALFQRCCEAIEFTAGVAMQAYLRSGPDDAARLISWARKSGRQISVRLIKGAYWDYEVINAERMGWPVPVWTEKRAADACFERMAAMFVDAIPARSGEGGIKLALGSHNVRSIAATLALLEKKGLPTSAVEFQKLYGMADPLREALVELGLRVREYVPVGEMIPGMAYLVRRLLENTSNQSWLRSGSSTNIPDDVLLAAPQPPDEPAQSAESIAQESAVRHQLSPAVPGLGDGLPLFNEPWRDFSQPAQRLNFSQAVAQVKVPKVEAVGGEACGKAITAADAAFPAWRDRPGFDRAEILVRAAGLMRDCRDQLAAVMIREAGKTWREADADVCEAIDFCDYYARVAVSLFEQQRLGRFVGELNHQFYQPRGVAAIISPWNFPLAICAGMTSAALVTGNTAVVKPSSQTRGIARLLCENLWQAGVPAEALQYLPGAGREVGDMLVSDPRVALIAFTGSKEIGLRILKMAGDPQPSQEFVKKVVCEMGGKNAIIVDDSADLDEAVLAVRQSAFGYSGQKCSACSRVIALEGIHDAFLHRLVESTRSLVIGDPALPGTDVGPVIDESAAAKIRQYIEVGRGEGRLELACEVSAGLAEQIGKPVIAPHIFSGIQPHHRLANEEIFGPVLAVMRAPNFAAALEIANSSVYKLTGGVFSRKPANLEAARARFRVGNLYLNRGITGALVGRQPFGGFGLSGAGSKAGGSDYLLHFVEPRSITENTMRHGFAPGME